MPKRIMLTHDGQTKSLSDWSRFTGIPVETISWRMRNGSSVREALKTGNRSITHGHSRRTTGETKIYKCWKKMRERCNNPNDQDYARYGGRGISICQRWNSFENFLNDMSPRPDGMSIDRTECDGNYEPSNCRWATQLQQTNNTSRNRKYTICNETKNLCEWCRYFDVPYGRVFARLKLFDWPILTALLTPPRKQPRYYTETSDIRDLELSPWQLAGNIS